MTMDKTEPIPADPSDFQFRLRQVFLEATRRLRQALELEHHIGGYMQGFVGGSIIPEATTAFKLRETAPKIVDGRLSTGEWIVHVPEGETGDTFLSRFWLERVVRVTDSRRSSILQFNKDGSTPIGTDDTLIGLEDLTEIPESPDFEADLSLIGLESVVEAKVDNLRRVARSMEDDFELVPFNS